MHNTLNVSYDKIFKTLGTDVDAEACRTASSYGPEHKYFVPYILSKHVCTAVCSDKYKTRSIFFTVNCNVNCTIFLTAA